MGMTMSFIMSLIMIEVVSDDELLECLRKVCIESSTWHRKLKRPMLKFQGSKQLCMAKAKSKHLEFKGVALKLKRSQIYNRIQMKT